MITRLLAGGNFHPRNAVHVRSPLTALFLTLMFTVLACSGPAPNETADTGEVAGMGAANSRS